MQRDRGPQTFVQLLLSHTLPIL
jgi:hypothetical protein